MVSVLQFGSPENPVLNYVSLCFKQNWLGECEVLFKVYKFLFNTEFWNIAMEIAQNLNSNVHSYI